jgi:phosphonopyruvate decarboxylase
MADVGKAFKAFAASGISFWTGVPDSLLKDFLWYVGEHAPDGQHVIAANEGGAVALAAGHYLATGRPAAVYLQNSGLGNTVNPLVSLADPAVYGIPMLLLIGWRGEPGTSDEPQHMKQGAITASLLETIGIPAEIAPEDDDRFAELIARSIQTAVEDTRPVAIVVPAGTFEPFASSADRGNGATMTREEALIAVAEAAPDDAVIVATTGKTARELYEHRRRRGLGTERDFLTVGSMGHASQIGLGIALGQAAHPVWVFDGDGALLMHMGALAVIGEHAPPSFKHIVFNNHAHDSVGGQPTPTERIDLRSIAMASGYRSATSVDEASLLADAVDDLERTTGPALLEIVVKPGARADLGRPESTPAENKTALMGWLGG